MKDGGEGEQWCKLGEREKEKKGVRERRKRRLGGMREREMGEGRWCE